MKITDHKKVIEKSSDILILRIVDEINISQDEKVELFNKLSDLKRVIKDEAFNSILRFASDFE